MATALNSYEAAGITAETAIFTAPTATEQVILHLSVANVGAGDALINIKRNNVHFAKGVPVAVGGTFIGESKIAFKTGDTLKVSSDVAVDVLVSTGDVTP
jgi:hypothetical protein